MGKNIKKATKFVMFLQNNANYVKKFASVRECRSSIHEERSKLYATTMIRIKPEKKPEEYNSEKTKMKDISTSQLCETSEYGSFNNGIVGKKSQDLPSAMHFKKYDPKSSVDISEKSKISESVSKLQRKFKTLCINERAKHELYEALIAKSFIMTFLNERKHNDNYKTFNYLKNMDGSYLDSGNFTPFHKYKIENFIFSYQIKHRINETINNTSVRQLNQNNSSRDR